MIATGLIASWNGEKGYGFIRPDLDEDGLHVFCHVSGLRGKWTPMLGDRVQYRVEEQARGPRAVGGVRLEPDGGG